MKLTSVQKKELESKIKHIVGTCQCPATSRTCLYWRNIDRRDRSKEEWQVDLIMKEISKL